MKPIFNISQIKKFDKILSRLGRECVPYYPNEDCQKSIFVQRVFKHFHQYWVIEFEEPTGFYELGPDNPYSTKELKPSILQYVSIARISYCLGWGEDIEVIFFKAGTNHVQTIKLNYNQWINLKGRKITKEKYNKVASMFYVKENEK